jgi:hypothetical protein
MSDLFDKAKRLLAENSDTVDDVVDKIAGMVDDQTGGKHKQQVSEGAEKAKDAIAGLVGADEQADRPKPAGGKAGAGKAVPGTTEGGTTDAR